MIRRATPLLLSALLLAVTGGCAHYEYDVVQPPELARHVGTKQWTSFQRDALEATHIGQSARNVDPQPRRTDGSCPGRTVPRSTRAARATRCKAGRCRATAT